MEHLVIFMNYDGKELYKVMVPHGATAVYQGGIPKKDGEEFIGWSKPLENIIDDTVVIAKFEKKKTGVLNLGAITFVEGENEIKVLDNVVISNEDLHITKENDMER